MEVSVVRKALRPDSMYIGRGSHLGNPFVMDAKHTRDMVCDDYEEWFKLHKDDAKVKQQLGTLLARLKTTGSVKLGCYCAPQRCHGDTIKRWLEENV